MEIVRLDQEFTEVRAKLRAEIRTEISAVEIDRLAMMLEHSMLKADEEIRQDGLDDDYFDWLQQEHQERQARFKRALARGDVSVVADAVEDWLINHGVSLDQTSESFKALAYRFLKAAVVATEKQGRRFQGDVVDTPPRPAGELFSVVPSVPTQVSDDGKLKLSGLFEKWAEEKRRTSSEGSLEDNRKSIDRFIELHGDMPVERITKAHVRDFKDQTESLAACMCLTHAFPCMLSERISALCLLRPCSGPDPLTRPLPGRSWRHVMHGRRFLLTRLFLACMALVLFLGGGQALAQTWYVAVDASGADDANNGRSPETLDGSGPWKSILHAAQTARAGDSIVVLPGVYPESGITFANSGAEDSPIVLKAQKPGTVIIDGRSRPGDGILLTHGQSHFVFEGLVVRKMDGNGIATADRTERPYRDIVIRHCELDHNAWSGAELCAVHGFELEGVDAHHNGFYGLNILPSRDGSISTANGAIRDCILHHHEGDEGHGLGINQGHDILVTGSEAYHNRAHGIDISDWPKKGEVSHHIVVEHCRSHDNGIAGFSVNSDSHDVLFRRNLAWANGADWAGMGTNYGFLCYEGCWDVTWEHNTAALNSAGGFSVEGSPGEYIPAQGDRLIFRNNLTFLNGKREWDERFGLDVTGSGYDIVLKHNDWGGEPRRDLPVVNLAGIGRGVFTMDEVNDGDLGPGEISLDPEFVDQDSADFRLGPDSPALDAGIAGQEPFCGAAPDLGALERCP